MKPSNSKSKKISKLALSTLIAVACLSPLASHANDDKTGPFFGKQAPGKWIIGGKVSKVDLNIPSSTGRDTADTDGAGIVVGYEFARPIGVTSGSSTIELEYLTADDNFEALGGSDVDIEVANLFFTYRSEGKLYYKLKAGLSFANFTVSNPLFEEFSSEDVGLAGGVGLGYRVGDLGVLELEYQADTSDADLSLLSVNALLEF